MKEWTGHVTDEWLNAWILGTLSATEERRLFAHAGSCSHCADLLARYLEQDLMEPPSYLQEEILEKSKTVRIQTGKTMYQRSKQLRLFLYSLKVSFAVAVSLLMLFILPAEERTNIRIGAHFLEDAQETITEKLQDSNDKMSLLLENLTGRLLFVEYEEEQND